MFNLGAHFWGLYSINTHVKKRAYPRHQKTPPEKIFGPLNTPPEVRPLGVPHTSSPGMTGGFWKTRAYFYGISPLLRGGPWVCW